MKRFLKVFNTLFSTSAAGFYILAIAFSIGAATFIENDFGTSSAQKLVFKTWWFEWLLAFFGISLIVNIIRFRMVRQRKWAILTFHVAMIVILIGAGATRYFGSEGMMHIREDSSSNSYLSSNSFLHFEAVHGGKKYVFDEPTLFATRGNNTFRRAYLLGDKTLQVEVTDFMPNPAEVMKESSDGMPVLKVVIGGMNGRQEHFVRYGDKVNINGTLFNFGNPEEASAFNIRLQQDSLFFMAGETYSYMQMATQKRDTLSPGVYRPLLLRSLYTNGRESFVFGDFNPKAVVEVESASLKMTNSSMGGVRVKLDFDGQQKEFYVYGSQGVEGEPRVVAMGNSGFSVSYGAKRVTLPFSIQLHDFIMEKYPGTNNASSYASEVTLNDPTRNLVRDQRIYMNHILNYRGYRFFQSSFDPDELGTYLSVNRDAWGTRISYLGYFLLTLGMILTFFSEKSRFRQLAKMINAMRQAEKALPVLLIGSFLAFTAPAKAYEPLSEGRHIVDAGHARQFGRILVQDYKGRMKPMNTFAGEILRKLARKEEIDGLIPEQVLLSMAAFPEEWYGVPMIKIGRHDDIRKLIPSTDGYASYDDFFGERGEYLLKEYVRSAYNMEPRDRGTFEKEIMKLDEKVNIANMVFSGSFMKVFPVPGDPSNSWRSPADSPHQHNFESGQGFMEKFYPAYIPTLQNAVHNSDWDLANRLLVELDQYQQKNGGPVLPSERKVKAELLLNKMNVFSRLDGLYAILGMAFLTLLFISVFNPRLGLKWPFRIVFGLFCFGFLMHTTGLGLRWYVSGRAPWSNGYESMIYIGWTTVLAGMIFGRKSYGGLAATSVLAATILMVAGLSFLDPEITPLVPVLKSYWLTIHVSMEAGSYGFLMLGAIIGVLNLIFMILKTRKNELYVNRVVKEMTLISEMTLIGGLFMVSIGTYLGGVWANESWGRYWGWDAKETWALVTILVYSFILHMRFIPGLRGMYAFNVATLFGWGSVMMTYFGVNYYLSGLHSYAAGDPVPIPPFLYYTVGSLLVLCLLAYWRTRQFGRMNQLTAASGR